MATEKTTGRLADYGDQVAGLHNVCEDLVGAMTGQAPARPAHPVPSKPEQPT